MVGIKRSHIYTMGDGPDAKLTSIQYATSYCCL